MAVSKQALHDFIAARPLAVLATVSDSGAPEAALVGVAVTPELELIFDTTEATRKYPNLKRDGRIAFVFGGDGEETLQYEGVADEPEGDELARLKALYFAAFPEGRERQDWPGLTYFRVQAALDPLLQLLPAAPRRRDDLSLSATRWR